MSMADVASGAPPLQAVRVRNYNGQHINILLVCLTSSFLSDPHVQMTRARPVAMSAIPPSVAIHLSVEGAAVTLARIRHPISVRASWVAERRPRLASRLAEEKAFLVLLFPGDMEP